MKQLYYVNGKRVDINTYANALNAQISAEEAQNVFEVKKKGFIEYVNKNPSVLFKWENTSFSPESIVQSEFNSWCNSDECKLLLKKYETQRIRNAWGCIILIVIGIVLFVLRVSGVL